MIRPRLIGHVRGNADVQAIRARDYIRALRGQPPVMVWIEEDGVILAMQPGASVPKRIQTHFPERVIGTYTLAMAASVIATDIREAASQFVANAMQEWAA